MTEERRAMAVMPKRERVLQVVLVVLGLLTVVTNIDALVTYFLAGPRPIVQFQHAAGDKAYNFARA